MTRQAIVDVLVERIVRRGIYSATIAELFCDTEHNWGVEFPSWVTERHVGLALRKLRKAGLVTYRRASWAGYLDEPGGWTSAGRAGLAALQRS